MPQRLATVTVAGLGNGVARRRGRRSIVTALERSPGVGGQLIFGRQELLELCDRQVHDDERFVEMN